MNQSFGVRLAAAAQGSIGAQVLVDASNFIASSVPVRYHLTAGTERLVRPIRRRVPVLDHDLTEFPGAGFFPVAEVVKQSPEFRR